LRSKKGLTWPILFKMSGKLATSLDGRSAIRHRSQLREGFPFDQLPRYLLRDRDAVFGDAFREHVRDMGICEVLSAPLSLAKTLLGFEIRSLQPIVAAMLHGTSGSCSKS
jgi:hypothetical protein